MTALMISFQWTVNVGGICCSSCMRVNLWPMQFIHGSWELQDVPAVWKLGNISVSRKDKKEDLANSSPACLSLVPGKITEEVIVRVNEKCFKDNTVVVVSTG